MKVALITGITGQDGSYLAELLLSKGYTVHGLKRRSSLFNTSRIDHLYKDPHEKESKFTLHYGDLTDTSNIISLIQEIQPDEIYNLAAMSHVKVSFEMPEYTGNVDALGVLRILEAVRILGLSNKCKIYQASTSELFGEVQEVPQSESTPFYPRSPYAVAKLYAHWMIINYRESYNMFAVNGILFNHESSRRGGTFVTRKVTMAACRICLGRQDTLHVGNLDAKRDWGHACDFVIAMWLMLQRDIPEDYVIATGKTTSVRDFIRMVFEELEVDIEFQGQGLDEIGVVKNSHKYDLPVGKVIVRVDPKYFRPAEVNLLVGDATKAKEKLGWDPKYTLRELINDMVAHDLQE